MYVRLQLCRDDGSIITEQVGNAFALFGQDFPLHSPVIENAGTLEGTPLYGFTYLPVPPPRDPADIAEFQRMYWELLRGQR